MIVDGELTMCSYVTAIVDMHCKYSELIGQGVEVQLWIKTTKDIKKVKFSLRS